jgi:hypothetical protein
MRQAELGELLERLRQTREGATALEPAQGAELSASGTARPHEVRMVGVREPVGACLRRPDYGTLGERQDRASRAGSREELPDRCRTFRVRRRVIAALLHGQRDPLCFRHVRQELGACATARAKLEVTERHAAASEESPAQVRATTARPRDEPPGRPLERRQPRADDTGLVEHLECARVARDVELVSRLAAERASPVAPDLARDAEPAEEAEGPPGDGRAR